MDDPVSVTGVTRRDRHGLSQPERDTVTSPFRGCHGVTNPGAAGHADTAGQTLVELADRVRRLVPSHRDPEAFHEAKSEIEAELRRLSRVLPADLVCGGRQRLSSLDGGDLSPKVSGLRKG
jgi:hypothetical protein